MSTDILLLRVPYRVSLFGGGSDYFEWFSLQGGRVCSFTINHYCYALCIKSDYDSYYRQDNKGSSFFLSQTLINDIQSFHSYDAMYNHFYIYHTLPMASGIASSSAEITAILNALNKLNNRHLSNKLFVESVIQTEQVIFNDKGGIQDQIIISNPGFRDIHINKNASFEVKNIELEGYYEELLFDHFLLCYLGGRDYDKGDLDNEKKKHAVLHPSIMSEISEITEQGVALIYEENIEKISEIGKLLDKSWSLKKLLSNHITNIKINSFYEFALRSGAYGGKLLGSGAGGFFLLLMPPKYQKQFIKESKSIECYKCSISNESVKVMIN